MPDHQSVKDNKALKIFGTLLHDANLWHLNRNSVAKAFAIGLFVAFIPVPFQMMLAAGAAIAFHANLPLSIAVVWISNPVTIPFIFYACYIVGTWVLRVPEKEFVFEANWQWLVDSLSTIGPAFLVGCLVLGVIFSSLGYFFIKILWRYQTVKAWKKRSRIKKLENFPDE